MLMPRRRTLLVTLPAWIALASTEIAFAQSKKPPVVIGWLNGGSANSNADFIAAFREGMIALGWREGTQFVIEERWAKAAWITSRRSLKN